MKALGISERLLRSLCAAHLGMSPTRYLRLRRMSLVREAHALFAGLGLDGLITLDLERIPHQLQVLGVVFDYEDETHSP